MSIKRQQSIMKSSICLSLITICQYIINKQCCGTFSLYYLRFFYHKFQFFFTLYAHCREKKYQKQHHHHLYNGVLAEVQREVRGEKMIDFVHHHHNQCANNRQVRVMKELLALSLFILRTKVQAINFECSTID